MIGRTVTGYILALERIGTTPNGNPTYSVAFQVDGGGCILGRSEPDSTLGYELGNARIGEPCEAVYHVTRGVVVFTMMKWGRA